MNDLPKGIGPHEGRELQLLLSGTKKAALFSDFIPDNGIMPEDIIPELSFAPYVENKTITRFSFEKAYPELNKKFRTVIFTQPNEEWRADALMWLREFKDDISHITIGRLLGYSEDDIQTYITHKKNVMDSD
jgi:hypothetical protein